MVAGQRQGHVQEPPHASSSLCVDAVTVEWQGPSDQGGKYISM